MSDRPTKSASGQTDWDRLRAARDEEIDYTDIPSTDTEFWKSAAISIPPGKTPVTVRMDKDVLDWFKRQGPGYQTRMNAVLRAYMTAHRVPRQQG